MAGVYLQLTLHHVEE